MDNEVFENVLKELDFLVRQSRLAMKCQQTLNEKLVYANLKKALEDARTALRPFYYVAGDAFEIVEKMKDTQNSPFCPGCDTKESYEQSLASFCKP